MNPREYYSVDICIIIYSKFKLPLYTSITFVFAMNKKRHYILTASLIILILILIFLVFNFTKKIGHLEDYNEYFRQPKENQQVQTWMTFHQVGREYHIDIKKVLGRDKRFSDMKMPISEYCTKEKVDCPDLIRQLNILKNEH